MTLPSDLKDLVTWHPHASTQALPPPFLTQISLHSSSHFWANKERTGVVHPQAETQAAPPPFLKQMDLHSSSQTVSKTSTSSA